MKHTCEPMRTLTTLILLTTAVTSSVAQNSCSTAQSITPGIYAVTAVDGPEAPSPVCINTGTATNAEWYRFTVVEDTTVRITTDLGSNTDTRFHVYQGNCGALSCVAGNDDISGSNLASTAVFDVQAGVIYRIAFDNNWTANGFSFQLELIEPVAPVDGMVTFTPSSIFGLTGGDCVVDMNGDHLDDVVRASTSNINIQYQIAGGGFQSVNIPTAVAENSPSWSIAAGDIDGNGYNDLIYGGGSGASFAIANDDGTAYSIVDFDEYIFCQRTNFVDVNNDGALDAFSCHDVDANVAFINDGEGNLSFVQGGLGETCGNYGSQWIDYDGDGDIDMFVAKCGCDPTDLLMRNNGNGTFTNVAPELGLSDSHQSWSSAWGDYDNDGDIDVMIGSSSSGYHKLMRNNGNGTFTNVTAGSGLDLFTSQSIEWATHDFNNDGYLDILGAGAILYGNGDMGFMADLDGPSTSAVGDLNNDGFLDIASWSGAFLNNGNGNNWLKVNTIGTVSNTNGLGARVSITSSMGPQLRDIRSGDAFSTMSSMTAHFGIGDDAVIEEVQVRWPSGIITTLNDVPANTTLNIVEGVSTTVDNNPANGRLRLYPNPTEGVVTVELKDQGGIQQAMVVDVTGKQVLTAVLLGGRMDVSSLAPGMYRLVVVSAGTAHAVSFVRE
jgi:hypothetical protein